ncbi:MAG: hypothetical protein MO847_11425, partial [Candidatus Protistobacter heckmanni]|nr:hypothetical protein [Candidatus Protistobacter heckmanni]
MHHARSRAARAVILAALAASAVLAAGGARAAANISFTAPESYPEGVAVHAAKKELLVSSMHMGAIGRVAMDGKYQPFIEDERLISSVGMTVDAKRNLLWVAIADPGLSVRSKPETKRKLAAAAAFDLATGKRVAYHDLGVLAQGEHFANDLTLDEQGNVYVTDSFSPVIYKIDAAGKASVFAQSKLFEGEGFNLNGIVHHPAGFLLVGKHNSGELLVVDEKDPTKIAKVKLPENFPGADGLVLLAPDRLLIVQNKGPAGGADRTVELRTKDNWASAELAGSFKSVQPFPTTAARAGNTVYVLNAKLGELFDPKGPRSKDYLLQALD